AITCASSFSTASKIGNLWVGDNESFNFYELDFATGNPATYDANLSCTGCSPVSSIQALGIYGGEGANQPGLARLLPPTPLNPDGSTPTQAFAPTVNFLENTDTVTLYGLSASVKLALWASLVDPGSCFNDQLSALPCRV